MQQRRPVEVAADALLQQLVALDVAQRREAGGPAHGSRSKPLVVERKYLHMISQLHHSVDAGHHVGGMLLVKVRGHRAIELDPAIAHAHREGIVAHVGVDGQRHFGLLMNEDIGHG